MSSPYPRFGEVLYIREEDYKYGEGVLAIRVTGMDNTIVDAEWIELKGVQISWDGQDIAERLVLVRIAAFRDPRSRQKP